MDSSEQLKLADALIAALWKYMAHQGQWSDVLKKAKAYEKSRG